MKRKDSDEIRAMSLDGSRIIFWSSYYSKDFDPIKIIKQKIDLYNENLVKLSYKPEQFLIVSVETYTWTNDDGVFVKRETLEEAIEVYPASI